MLFLCCATSIDPAESSGVVHQITIDFKDGYVFDAQPGNGVNVIAVVINDTSAIQCLLQSLASRAAGRIKYNVCYFNSSC